MSRSAAVRASVESIPESLPDDLETVSSTCSQSEDEYEDDYEEDESSSSGGSEESFESYHEDDNNNNHQNKSRPQSHKSNIPSRKTSALQPSKIPKPSGTAGRTHLSTNNTSKIPHKKKELKFEESPHLPTSRLKQLLDSDLIFFQENEVKDLKKLKELNKTLINHLKVYHKYGIQVMEEEFREEKKQERERRERERKEREHSEKDKQARREEERKRNFEEWKKQKQEKKVAADPLSLFSEEVARLQNMIGEKDVEIKNLKDEIRSLNSVQRRQARALKDMDTEREHLPKQITSFHEELLQTKEKARLLQIQADKDRKTITQQHEQIETLKAKLQREDQSEESEDLMNEVEEKKKQLEELDRKFAILMKAKESDTKKYKQQIKALETELAKHTSGPDAKSPRRTVSASSLSNPSGSKIPVRKKPTVG